MNFDWRDFLIIRENTSEEKELLNLTNLTQDLNIQIDALISHEISNFYDDLITKTRSLIYTYVLDQINTICSPVQKYLFLLHDLFEKLSGVSFMNEKYLMNFLYKRIFLFYNSLNAQDNIIMIINDSIRC